MTNTENKINELKAKMMRMDELSAQLTALNESVRAMDTHGDENFARYCDALKLRQSLHSEMRQLGQVSL